MTDRENEDGNLFPRRVGERLRAAREAAGLELTDIASRTRVQLRHLEAMETGDFSALPSITYTLGFGKAYARAVGVDEVETARSLRQEMEVAGTSVPKRVELQPYEPADPARVPTRLLTWTAVAIALLVLVGYGIWRSEVFVGGSGRSEAEQAADAVISGQETPAPAPAATPAAPPVPTGPVVLTAVDTVWLRITDGEGKRLLEKELATGERYEVPPDAITPTLTTGRAEALTVSVGGVAVPGLGEGRVEGIGIGAAALAARGAAPPAAATPAGGAQPSPTPSSATARPRPTATPTTEPALDPAAPGAVPSAEPGTP
ncbi:transcriptional regulator with XRE-family HTH domain [Sphingomonas zeicaulis]|uniref:helix-turn-helix domain-containing protein n=1 Tax=Sphingomonas zeicaulis TaxID=1632740 RepID=UPI003D23D9F9